MSIYIEETEACTALTIDKALVEGLLIEDSFGDSICVAKRQAEELIPILQHFIATGELPE